MGITTGLTMSSPIAVRPRQSIQLEPDLLERVAHDRSGDVASRAIWRAQVAGDRVAIRAITAAYLASTSNAPTGIGRERLFLMGAAAHADHVEVRCVADLLLFLDAMCDGLALMQMASMDFGARRPGVLDSPAADARERISETRRSVELLVSAGEALPWVVVRNLSFFGDLRLSAAVSRALMAAGDGGDAEVVRAAHIRRLHQHPEMAVEIIDELLSTTMNPKALNVKAGALGDLCQFAAAAEVALVSIAVCPNDYSGNVGRRAFRNIGRSDLSAKSDSLARLYAGDPIPTSFPGTRAMYISLVAADVLNCAGRRDLAEFQMSRQRSDAEWAQRAREAIDADKSLLDAVRMVNS
jgi:hypothetical protein